MDFKMKYPITQKLIPAPSKRRSGKIMSDPVSFLVAHDSGNPGSTAMNNVDYYIRSCQEKQQSAHFFVDDLYIVECVPALGRPEKAWHVRYDEEEDDILFGDESNDAAIGVEYCYGTNIKSNEAYKRFVWIFAYLCYYHKLDPAKRISAHMILDPGRRTDPQNGLSVSGRSYKQFLLDVVTEFTDCIGGKEKMEQWQKEMGEKAVNNLAIKGLITNPEQWKDKLGENVPNWLFFEMMNRLATKVGVK